MQRLQIFKIPVDVMRTLRLFKLLWLVVVGTAEAPAQRHVAETYE